MCTITFIARKRGYALGMNRDEKLTRSAAAPPAIISIDSRQALFPSEPGGGTWIGVNDAGVCFALINWYAVSARVQSNAISRGQVVRSVLTATSLTEANSMLSDLPLESVNPFRLIGFFPWDYQIVEWKWDLNRRQSLQHHWGAQTWISSGFDEAGAQESRGKNFAKALRQDSNGSLTWLRRLHRSHRPGRGPYSTCMHRADAATVSYSEVLVTEHQANMRYCPGAPCQNTEWFNQTLPLKPSVTV